MQRSMVRPRLSSTTANSTAARRMGFSARSPRRASGRASLVRSYLGNSGDQTRVATAVVARLAHVLRDRAGRSRGHIVVCGMWRGATKPHTATGGAHLTRLAHFPVRVAYLTWTMAGLVASVCTCRLIARAWGRPMIQVLAGFFALPTRCQLDWRFGQLHLWLFVFVTAAWLADRKGREVTAGLWLGVATSLETVRWLARAVSGVAPLLECVDDGRDHCVRRLWGWSRLALDPNPRLAAPSRIGELAVFEYQSVRLGLCSSRRSPSVGHVGNRRSRRRSGHTAANQRVTTHGPPHSVPPYSFRPLRGCTTPCRCWGLWALCIERADRPARWLWVIGFVGLCVPLSFQVAAMQAGRPIVATVASWYTWALLFWWVVSIWPAREPRLELAPVDPLDSRMPLEHSPNVNRERTSES